jgi:hypothetical protein
MALNVGRSVFIYKYLYNVCETSQRSILRGVGSLWHDDTIQVK